MSAIIDGKAAAARLRAKVAEEAARLGGVMPGLTVILVGNHPASEIYVRSRIKAGREAGFDSRKIDLPEDLSQEALLAEIARLNADPAVHGILVQLPLPSHISENAVIHAIDPAKDVDGFHPVNMGKLWAGEEALIPCTPLGCLMLLKETLGELSGCHAVILGRSNIVGKPMAALLLRESATITVAHSRTRDLPGLTRQADILVAAVGKPGLVRADWLRPGVTVIDVGINRVEGGIVGDVAFDECREVAGAITPVPGGVGPMTIACLLHNTLKALKYSEKR